MKKKIIYNVNGKKIEKEYNFIPVRYIIAVLITLLEIAAIIGAVIAMCYYVPYFYIAAWVTQIVCVIRIISSDDNPDYKIPWLLFVLILPITGFMLYFLFYSRKLQKKFIKRMDELKGRGYERVDEPLFAELKAESVEAHAQAKMLCKISGGHLFTDTKQRYFALGEEMWKSMLVDLQKAKKYVYITTPYLIIDNELCQTIETAALRGVTVKLITPHIPDKKLVFGITRSFYSRLMDAGVEIYEYEPGFIHAKNYLVDGEYGMIGTINLDYRSLVHHFENGVWLYRAACLKDVKKDMESTLEKSIRITKENVKANVLQRGIRSVARIFAALL